MQLKVARIHEPMVTAEGETCLQVENARIPYVVSSEL